MRVQSDRPKQLQGGEIGWLHPVGDTPAPRSEQPEPPRPILNVAQRLKQWRCKHGSWDVSSLSASLGVTNHSLEVLECQRGPSLHTWAFPMRYGDNSYSGIRIRHENGDKWAERGSHSGLFIPQCDHGDTVLICEGPTDCAAALTLGYFAIGRPSCCGGVEHLQAAIRRLKIRRAVVVSDLDDPGLRGAKGLCEHLQISTAILVCPSKDLRQFVNRGGDRETMDAMIGQLMWKSALVSAARNAETVMCVKSAQPFYDAT